MDVDSRFGKMISVIKLDVKEWIDVKLELLKLEACEKVSTVASTLVYGLIIVLIAFFSLLFAFIALSFWFGQLIHNIAGGFGLGAILYLIILAVLFACRKAILSFFTNMFLKTIDSSLIEEEESGIKEKKVHEFDK